MKHKDYDGAVVLLQNIALATKHEANALKAKKNSQARAYRTELNQWLDALLIFLADGLSRRHPGDLVDAVMSHHVIKLVDMTETVTISREWCLDEIEKILKENP